MTEENNIKYLPLSQLPVNTPAEIMQISDSDVSVRLTELGFRVGETTECVGKSPLGGMRAYRVSQSIIALRERDAELITVTYGS